MPIGSVSQLYDNKDEIIIIDYFGMILKKFSMGDNVLKMIVTNDNFWQLFETNWEWNKLITKENMIEK